ncbi:MAG: AraC family transcriptional activator of pobA [Crocinitomix sp.]
MHDRCEALKAMKKEIPQIKFNPQFKGNCDFEIVTIEKIANHKAQYAHNPELPHQVKFYNLIFFTKGAGRHFIDFTWYDVKENSLLYISKEQVNAFEFSKDLKGFCIIFTEEHLLRCLEQLPENTIYRLFTPQLFSPLLEIPANTDFKDYLQLLIKESESDIFNRNVIIESLFTILLSKAEGIKQNQSFHVNDSSKIKLFQQFHSLLEDKFSVSRSANFYATQLAITYKHLNVICKELVHKTAKSVIDDFIILQAKRNLINSTIKSTELAYKMGFEDPTNFTKYFKKNTGLTPNSFKTSYNK